MGGSLAYFTWQTSESQKTEVTFTVEKQFSCSADGGGNITSSSLVPTSCNSNNAIKRTIKTIPQITGTKTIYMNLWLDVKEIGEGLSNSNNLKYVLSTSSTSCETSVVSSGTFNGAVENNQIQLMSGHTYTKSITDTYYLYIWLDKAEISPTTQNQRISLSLNGSCTDNTQPESPDLDDGLIPVVVTGNGQAMTINKDYDNWYSYDNKQWANAVMVTNESRSNYKNTSGVFIPKDDILAYYVWIPRYKYSFPTKYCSSLTNSSAETNPECYKYILSDSDKTSLINWWQSIANENFGSYTLEQATKDIETGVSTGSITITDSDSVSFVELISIYNNDNDPDITYTAELLPSNKVTGPREISISFENKAESKSIGNAIDANYRTHPAFTFGNTELNGIWVGKFETTGNATTPTIKPNIMSLRSQNVSTQFITAQKFGTSNYGSTSKIDAHMMKNSEWGAVAYLSHSKYGINGKIYINNSSRYYTGRSAGTVVLEETKPSTHGRYTWDGINIFGGGYVSDRTLGTKASTTGNITGIYDMSGGALDRVMGNYNDMIGNSGFNTMPDSKYYDKYIIDNNSLCTIESCGGHALFETTNWHNESSRFVNSFAPWFARGSSYSNGTSAGAFSSDNNDGSEDSITFRSVIVYIK